MSAAEASLAIRSVGVYLPPIVRRNDYWPAHIVERWRAEQERSLTRPVMAPGDPDTEGARLTLEAMREVKHDAFEGARERRIMPKEMWPSAMAIAAARDAIERAHIDPREIDLVLSYSTTPDFLHLPDGYAVHRDLGLSSECPVYTIDAMCNAFLEQLTLAERLMANSRMRYALLVQTSHMSAFLRDEEPFSAWFGDGATAAVVSMAANGHGILGRALITDSSFYGATVTGTPGGRWYGGERIVFYVPDGPGARLQFLRIADTARPLLEAALDQAGLSRSDVSFWACHQATAWLAKATQRYVGLEHARRADTFPWAGSVASCNLPLVLSTGEREGLLHEGDVVAMFSGTPGMSAAVTIARWGA